MESENQELALARCYRKKYQLLRKHCEKLQRVNERMLSRMYNVKKITRRYKRDRIKLIQALDERGDNWRDAEVPAFWEEGNVYRIMIENPNGPPGWRQKQTQHTTLDDGTTSATTAATAPPPKKKAERDRNAPRRPINAYFMYCSEKRHEVQDEYWDETGREITRHELTRVMAIKWNQLTVEQKKVYYDRYEVEKVKYEAEMKRYRDEQQRKRREEEAAQKALEAQLNPPPMDHPSPHRRHSATTLLPTNLDDGLEPLDHGMRHGAARRFDFTNAMPQMNYQASQADPAAEANRNEALRQILHGGLPTDSQGRALSTQELMRLLGVQGGDVGGASQHGTR